MNVKALQEVAELTGLKSNTLRVAAINGRLPASKSGKVWLVDLDNPEVQTYLESFKPKEHTPRGEEWPKCEVCGKPVPRARAKYCSQECYTKTF